MIRPLISPASLRACVRMSNVATLRRERWEQTLLLTPHINARVNAAYAKLRGRVCMFVCLISGAFCSLADEVSGISSLPIKRARRLRFIGKVCLVIVGFQRMSNECARALVSTRRANCPTHVPALQQPQGSPSALIFLIPTEVLTSLAELKRHD